MSNHPKTLVMKFGGAAVATPEHFARIADVIINRMQDFQRVAIVVSAMANTTDQLIDLAKKVNPDPPRREYDMLVTVGERISIALLAMALSLKRKEAISFTGSQSGIITCGKHSEARIIDVKPHRILPVLESGKIAIVAGFQGVSKGGEITTLGRGGSDTSAVALGVALKAQCVEFYKDVPGVFDADPKRQSDACMYNELTFDDALKIVLNGAKILHPRSIELAKKNNMILHVRSFNEVDESKRAGTLIRDHSQRNSEIMYENEC